MYLRLSIGAAKTKGEKNHVSTGLIGISRKYAVLLMTGVYGIRTDSLNRYKPRI